MSCYVLFTIPRFRVFLETDAVEGLEALAWESIAQKTLGELFKGQRVRASVVQVIEGAETDFVVPAEKQEE